MQVCSTTQAPNPFRRASHPQAFFCESCAISATRIYVQDERQIMTDPCDNRIIVGVFGVGVWGEVILFSPGSPLPSSWQRFNNLMQLLSCICDILSIFFRELRHLARIIDFIADIVYCMCVLLQPLNSNKQSHRSLPPPPTFPIHPKIRTQACMQVGEHHHRPASRAFPLSHVHNSLLLQPRPKRTMS